MKKITSEEIQDKTIQFLTAFYKRKYQISQVSTTIKPLPGKIKLDIDILLNFNSSLQTKHTVIINTQSFSALESQLSFKNYKHPLLTLAAIFGCIVAYYYLDLLPWYGILGITAVIFVLLWGIIKVSQRIYRENRTKKIIDQLEKTPSNEKWIVITKTGLNFLKGKKTFSYLTAYNSLIKHALREKIGVLVATKQKIQILQKPGFTEGIFLDQYSFNSSTTEQPFLKKI